MDGGAKPARQWTAQQVSREIITAAMKVHSALGPGLLESAYEICLMHELRQMGLGVQAQVSLPVVYNGVKLDAGYRIDLLVEELVVVELKTVDAILPVHKAQVISYLKRAERVLVLINFNVAHLREGIKGLVHGSGWKT